MMKLGLLTSVETRHRYFVNRLRSELSVVAVGYEQAVYSQAGIDHADLTEEEARIVKEHFTERTRQEERFFGNDAGELTDSDGLSVRRLPQGALNSEATLRFLLDAGVDTVAVYGTNLIKEPLLGRFAGRLVNMHLGLSPYYRGTATNFYPLLNEEPEYVGATIHLLDAGIDSGPILAHARPDIVEDDMPHTIGCKAIGAGIETMIRVLRNFDSGKLTPVPQWEVPGAKLYLRKDYHPRQVVELYRKLDAGLIRRYVARADDVAKHLRLIKPA